MYTQVGKTALNYAEETGHKSIIELLKVSHLIGASLSEPHTSELNGVFFIFICVYIYLPYIRRSVNANWHSFNPKNCAYQSVRAKYRKQLRKGSTLEFSYTDWPSEAPKSAQEQEDQWWRRKRQSLTCCRDSRPKEWKVEKLRVRDHAKRATLNC